MILGQLSDTHLNGTPKRRTRLLEGLHAARMAGVGHLVMTGDLTAHGTEAQVHELGAVLDAGWPGARATLVPGNHDEGSAFDRALEPGGPLSRFRADSLGAVPLGDVVVLPLDTRFDRRRAFVFRAMGKAGTEGLGALGSAIGAHQGKTIVVAMHHGPQGHFGIDDLVDRAAFGRMMAGAPNVHVICGHDHRLLDKGRVHVAPSVAYHPEPLRTYHAGAGGLTVAFASRNPGRTFTLQQIGNEVSGLGALPLPLRRLLP